VQDCHGKRLVSFAGADAVETGRAGPEEGVEVGAEGTGPIEAERAGVALMFEAPPPSSVDAPPSNADDPASKGTPPSSNPLGLAPSPDGRAFGARNVDGALLAFGRSDADDAGSTDALATGVIVNRGSSSWRNAV